MSLPPAPRPSLPLSRRAVLAHRRPRGSRTHHRPVPGVLRLGGHGPSRAGRRRSIRPERRAPGADRAAAPAARRGARLRLARRTAPAPGGRPVRQVPGHLALPEQVDHRLAQPVAGSAGRRCPTGCAATATSATSPATPRSWPTPRAGSTASWPRRPPTASSARRTCAPTRTARPDFWPYLPLLQALRSRTRSTPATSSVLNAMTAFLRFMNAQPGSVFSAYWLSFRVADGLDVVYWLYNRTGEAFLLDLADTMHANSANWLNNLPTPHNVNLAQGFREPAVYALRSGQSGMTQNAYQNYASIMGRWGQFPGGGFAGDENGRIGYARPPPGLRDLRRRGADGQPRTAEPAHRRPGLGRPLRAAGVQHAAGRPGPAGQGHALHQFGEQRGPVEHREDPRPVQQRLGDAGVHARRGPVPLLPAQLRPGLAVLHRGAVGRHAGQRSVRGDVRPLRGHRKRVRRALGHHHRDPPGIPSRRP